MPTLCKYENCRTRPKNSGLYCSAHSDISENVNEITKCRGDACTSKPGSKNFKGYCSDCYIRIFEDDPLTFQIRCKTKEIAINEFIHCYFDGFAHAAPLWFGTTRIDNRIRIGNTTLCIEVLKKHTEPLRFQEQKDQKYIFIRFNPDKYMIGDKSHNPMLYTRLPLLEKEINHQINRVLQKENVEVVEIINLFYNLP
jgi:hypothetical protein